MPSAPDGAPRGPSTASRLPAALVVVVLAAALEAVLLLAAAGAYLVLLVRQGTIDVVFAALTVAFAVAVAVGLLVCARGLTRRRRWARAPVITWQLLQSAAVVPALGGPLGAGAAALLALAAVAVVALLTPAAVRATALVGGMDGTAGPPMT